MRFARLLLFFLAISLVIQNTCPYGLAAKTGFMAKEIHHCPLKKHSPAKADADDSAKKVTFQSGQTFVFTVGNANTTAPLSSKKIAFFFSEINLYKNISTEPPIKPPSFV